MTRKTQVTMTDERKNLISSKLVARIMKHSSEKRKPPDAKVLKVVRKFQERRNTPDGRILQILTRSKLESGSSDRNACR